MLQILAHFFFSLKHLDNPFQSTLFARCNPSRSRTGKRWMHKVSFSQLNIHYEPLVALKVEVLWTKIAAKGSYRTAYIKILWHRILLLLSPAYTKSLTYFRSKSFIDFSQAIILSDFIKLWIYAEYLANGLREVLFQVAFPLKAFVKYFALKDIFQLFHLTSNKGVVNYIFENWFLLKYFAFWLNLNGWCYNSISYFPLKDFSFSVI